MQMHRELRVEEMDKGMDGWVEMCVPGLSNLSLLSSCNSCSSHRHFKVCLSCDVRHGLLLDMSLPLLLFFPPLDGFAEIVVICSAFSLPLSLRRPSKQGIENSSGWAKSSTHWKIRKERPQRDGKKDRRQTNNERESRDSSFSIAPLKKGKSNSLIRV